MSRTPLMAGNWKMNLNHQEAVVLVQKLSWTLNDKKHDYAKAEVVVLPPFTDIRSVQTLVEAVKNNICGKTRRELVPGTLQVHLMKNYGALEIGVHRFHPAAKDAPAVGEAQFIHLWQNKDGAWKITRVISYDHASAGK